MRHKVKCCAEPESLPQLRTISGLWTALSLADCCRLRLRQKYFHTDPSRNRLKVLDCGDRQKSDATWYILSLATCSRARAVSKVFRIEPSRSPESHWSRPWLCLALHGTVSVLGPNFHQRSWPISHRVWIVVVARIPFILGGPYCAKPCTNEGSRPPKRLCATSSPTNKYCNKYQPNK